MLLVQEKKYNTKSNLLYILFPIVFCCILFGVLYLTTSTLFTDQKWYIITAICVLPFYAFYTLISFSFIGWRYGKIRANKFVQSFTFILRGSIQIIVLTLLCVLSYALFFKDLGSSEIAYRKNDILKSHETLINQSRSEKLRPIETALNFVNEELSSTLVRSKKSNLRKVERQYFENQISLLTKRRDSVSDILSNLNKKFEADRLKYLQKITSEVEKNTFFFIRLKYALQDIRFYFISGVCIILFILFNRSFYKRFLSVKSDYFNLNQLLHQKLLDQELTPIVEHTKDYLIKRFNYHYQPPLSTEEVQELKEKVKQYKSKDTLIEKLKSVD